MVTHLVRTANGWTARINGTDVYLIDGRAYWAKDRFDGRPLTMDEQNALDHAAMVELYGAAK